MKTHGMDDVHVKREVVPFEKWDPEDIENTGRVKNWRTRNPIVRMRSPFHIFPWAKGFHRHEMEHIITGEDDKEMHHPAWHLCCRVSHKVRLFPWLHVTAEAKRAGDQLMLSGSVFVTAPVDE